MVPTFNSDTDDEFFLNDLVDGDMYVRMRQYKAQSVP